jgi:hypothetical protein
VASGAAQLIQPKKESYLRSIEKKWSSESIRAFPHTTKLPQQRLLKKTSAPL